MSYFEEHSEAVRFTSRRGDLPGLREAQRGAAQAVGAHFALRNDPALVSMPTGSGKTRVIELVPFLLRARRVLVITPATMVRGQIADGLSDLSALKSLRVLPDELEAPTVGEVTSRISDAAGWAALAGCDVVVATPHTISPIYAQVAAPASDLFDLVLVDEAHHEAARGWRELLDVFPEARRVLFSATPFRRDRKEIRGRFVFDYPLRRAMADGIFGTLRFRAADPSVAGDPDLAIAREAERLFARDRDAGLEHRLMVRTSTKSRAKDLAQLYADNSGLRLRLITSDHSYAFARRTVRMLREGELDGVVCVDMLGEGFDLPQLKVAALHAPHRSLARTLQFIGRFARVGEGTGEATVIAVPDEIGDGIAKLYREDAAWPELLADFSREAIDRERTVREDIATFDEPAAMSPDLEKLSLYSLRPFCHSKVFRAPDGANVSAPLDLPGFETVFRQDSPELSMAVAIVRRVEQPRWTTVDALASISYELIAVFHDVQAKLVFINSSCRNDSLYARLAAELCDGNYGTVSSARINRVLRGIVDPCFFHVGMKNSNASSGYESYVTKSGSQAHRSVSAQDGKLYHRGHLMARGTEQGEEMTIGFSTASRVWSMANPQVTEWREWCRRLANKIASEVPFTTGTNLDLLTPAEEVRALPADAIAAQWPPDVFQQPIMLVVPTPGADDDVVVPLQDVQLDLDIEHASDPGITGEQRLRLETGEAIWHLRYSPAHEPCLSGDADLPDGLVVRRGRHDVNLLDYLNANPPTIFLSDCSMVEGQELRRVRLDPPALPEKVWVPWQWPMGSVNREFNKDDPADPATIHGHLRQHLLDEKPDWLYYDHGSGEAADFVAAWDRGEDLLLRLYHCKAAKKGKDPGCRLEELYEVVGQAVKCIRHLGRPTDLLKNVKRRGGKRPSRHVVGNLSTLKDLIDGHRGRVSYHIAIVQPGLSKAEVTEQAAELVAGANEFLRRDMSGEDLTFICSA